jgi:hypothetical protein
MGVKVEKGYWYEHIVPTSVKTSCGGEVNIPNNKPDTIICDNERKICPR